MRAFNFERGDRVAAGFGVPAQYAEQFEAKYGPDYGLRFNHRCLCNCIPKLTWPNAPGKWVDDGKDKVWWYTAPLFEDYRDADKLVFPDPRNSPDVFESLEKNLKERPDHAMACAIIGPITILHGMRLQDNIYTDVYDDPDGVHRTIKRIMDIQTDLVRQAVALPFDIIFYMDDIASSKGLLMSREMLCEYVLDYFEEGIEIAKKHGKKVAYHTDGNVMDLLDDMHRVGIDCVNPMQPQFNNFEEFMRKFDGKMMVWGGIDNLDVIPFGTPEDVKNHVEYVFSTLGKNGGLIMGTHEIRSPVTFENWEALLGTIHDCLY